MKGFTNWAYNASWFTLGIVVASILLFGVVAVQAATTISTNITTGGTLDVSGLSSLAGFQSTASSSVSSTFRITGLETQVAGFISEASSTARAAFTVGGAALFQDIANASSTLQATGDVTFYGGSGALTLTTTNAATSTAVVGCIQTYATSTASPIKQMFFASSTLNIDSASVTAGFGGGTIAGLVLWGFGTCP